MRPRELTTSYDALRIIAHGIAGVTLVLVLVLLEGCSAVPNAAVTGNWLFKLTTSGSDVILATVNLTQNGSDVSGQAIMGGSGVSCGATGEMFASGTVKGDTVTLQFTQFPNIVVLSGTANVTFTFLTGTFTETGGSCLPNGGIGSWSAALQ